MVKYNHKIHNFGDHDLDSNFSNAEIAYSLLDISNELAEANRLKRIELDILITTNLINPDNIRKFMELIKVDDAT